MKLITNPSYPRPKKYRGIKIVSEHYLESGHILRTLENGEMHACLAGRCIWNMVSTGDVLIMDKKLEGN